jgi:hypothetical protein
LSVAGWPEDSAIRQFGYLTLRRMARSIKRVAAGAISKLRRMRVNLWASFQSN